MKVIWRNIRDGLASTAVRFCFKFCTVRWILAPLHGQIHRRPWKVRSGKVKQTKVTTREREGDLPEEEEEQQREVMGR